MRHPNHPRIYPAVLTPEGARVLDACDVAVDEFEEAMLRDLDDDQRAALTRGLTSAVQALGAGLPQPLQLTIARHVPRHRRRAPGARSRA